MTIDAVPEAAGFTSARLAFRPGTRVSEADGALTIQHAAGAFRVRGLPDSVRGLLERMASAPDGEDIAALHALALADRAATVLARLEVLVQYRLLDDRGRVALCVETMAAGAVHRPADLGSDDRLRLSRFALLRTDEQGALLESPLTARRIRPLTADARALVTALDVPSTPAQIAGRLGLPPEETRRLLAHLVGAGLVHVENDGRFPDTDAVLRQWEFHDLLFHARSRIGRHDYPFGGTFPFKDEISPLPAVRPAHSGRVVELPRPDVETILEHDPQLTTVLEGRRSIRAHGEKPITLAQLGEFLYRTARVRAHTEPLPDRGMPYAATTRPYPTGGAGYDLELYLSVHRCDGLSPGIYHYDPAKHTVTLVNEDTSDRQAMLDVARLSAGRAPAPDILITLTSRFQRLGWKYRSLPYAATLKNVGVLYQTMYLVATAMNLSACALGGGDADLAARAFHVDYLEESSVGEFLLGGSPDDPPLSTHSAWSPVNNHDWYFRATHTLGECP